MFLMKVIFTDDVPYKKKTTKKTPQKTTKKRGAPRSDFFHFHSVFGKPFANNRGLAQIQGLAPPSGKSWIRHWKWHITYSPWRIKGWGRGRGGRIGLTLPSFSLSCSFLDKLLNHRLAPPFWLVPPSTKPWIHHCSQQSVSSMFLQTQIVFIFPARSSRIAFHDKKPRYYH